MAGLNRRSVVLAGNDIECDFQPVFYFDGAAADFYRRYAVIGLQDRDFALCAECVAIGVDMQRDADGLSDSVQIQLAGHSEFPSVGSFLCGGDRAGSESDLREFGHVENFFAFHGGLDFFAIFVGLSGVDYGDGFGGNLQMHGGFVDLLRIKLHFTGDLLGGDEVIVAEGLEGALLADVNLHFALLGID